MSLHNASYVFKGIAALISLQLQYVNINAYSGGRELFFTTWPPGVIVGLCATAGILSLQVV